MELYIGWNKSLRLYEIFLNGIVIVMPMNMNPYEGKPKIISHLILDTAVKVIALSNFATVQVRVLVPIGNL